MRGSIKERWCQDDYDVTIVGIFQSDNFFTAAEYAERLCKICSTPGAVPVVNDMLQSVYGITRLVIESFDFPFTKGEDNQQFMIRAFSDDNYTLLEELGNV
jgi:hypothetical protein